MSNAYEIALEAMNQVEGEPKPGEDIKITCMSDIVEQPITWLWPARIACGKLTVMAGNPGLGKSQLSASMAAMVSRGLLWPDHLSIAPLGDVIFLSAEDDPADTIKPRLIAAGADANRCHVLQAILTTSSDGKSRERTFDLTKDIDRLSAALDRLGTVRLVIIDPISAYLGDTDSYNNADMRGVLAPLAAMAAKHNVAVLLVTHLNKAQGQDMLARVSGSVGLIAAARAGYAVVKDEKNPDLRYFLPIKNNVGNDKDGFSYVIEQKTLDSGIITSHIIWNLVSVKAQDIFYPPLEEKPAKSNKAADWLRELLTDKPMSAKQVYTEANGAGFSKYQIMRAKEALGIEPRKQQGVANGGWVWSMPDHTEEIEDGEESNVSGLASQVSAQAYHESSPSSLSSMPSHCFPKR